MKKLIHTSDLHLDSQLSSLGNSEKSCVRRQELLSGFRNLVVWANENDVDGILICGDLFESGHVSPKVKRDLLALFCQFSNIQFFLLCGNHDADAFDAEFCQSLPQNVKTFSKSGETYKIGNITIFGIETDRSFSVTELPVFAENSVNIVMLHGSWEPTETETFINLKKCEGRKIDYLALGHFHSFQKKAIDSRGVACYSGCLQPRGFDECGQKGFVLLEVKDGKVATSVVPFAEKQFHVRAVDITACSAFYDALARVENEIKDISANDGIKVELCGEIAEGCEPETERMQRELSQRFFAVRVVDKTRVLYDANSASNELSLKSEFKRIINEMDADDQTKQEILRLGLAALRKEDLV